MIDPTEEAALKGKLEALSDLDKHLRPFAMNGVYLGMIWRRDEALALQTKLFPSISQWLH